MQQHIIKKQTANDDWTRAQIIALLHDNNITLAAIARANGLADAGGLSLALTRSFPLGEQRIAAALNMHPMNLWPTRYNSDGTRKVQGLRARSLNTQINSVQLIKGSKDEYKHK